MGLSRQVISAALADGGYIVDALTRVSGPTKPKKGARK
jgi:hypothetical protein